MGDDNLFEDDDALDYTVYEDVFNESTDSKNSGCLTLLVAFLTPLSLFRLWL